MSNKVPSASARRIVGRLVARSRRHLPARPSEGRPPGGRPTSGSEPASGRPDQPPVQHEMISPEATLVHAIQEGASLPEAVIRQLRDLLRDGDTIGAQSFAEALVEDPSAGMLGRVTVGIVASHRGFSELAWSHLETLPVSLWGRFAADEYVRAGLAMEPERAIDEVRKIVGENPPEVSAESWLALVGIAFAAGESDLARELFARFGERLDEDPRPRPLLRRQREWLAPWVKSDPASPKASHSGRPTIAVIDYGHPGMNRASANIGDHVQSIASLGHLVRNQRVRFRGQEDLVDLLEHLRVRTRPELQKSDIEAEVDVLTVHRDASMYQEIPEGTWVLCFGWFMHALFRLRFGFPLHDALRPIFISFHCNKRDLLTDEAIAYLRRYGPVGCRDWTTVYLLLSVGVPAFFSGCLTTTVNTLFPDNHVEPGAKAPVAYVDVPAEDVPAGAPSFKHSAVEVRTRSFSGNCYEALQLLETYRRGHRAVVTSRLHCYLPVRSLGMEVDFQPANRADVRFDGLIDITDDAFARIRSGILAKLDRVYSAILSSASEEDVYSLWREITAEEVEHAEQRWLEEMRLPVVPEVVHAELEEARSRTLTVGPVEHADAGEQPVHCVVDLPNGQGVGLEALVASLEEHASRPLHVWVLSRHQPAKLRERLARTFPQVTFSWVPTRRIGRGITTPTGEPVLDVAWLAIEHLLPQVGRVVVLPAAAVATADVAELAGLDLGDNIFAAPDEVSTSRVSGFSVVYGAAQRLEHRTQLAASLRRAAHARHAFDFDAFSTGVMVMNLERMRQEGFAASALPLVEEFGMGWREVLHFLAGPNRARVPVNWSQVPTWSPTSGPGIVHWADEVKPWDRRFTAGRNLWATYAPGS
jgi:hypothetical protein